MDSNAQIEKLKAAAEKLLKQAQTDGSVAGRLEKDPAGAISGEAGCPLPKGVTVKFSRGADGKMSLVPEVDPKFAGELDDKVLDSVAGGKTSTQRGLERDFLGMHKK